jgi:hypothetical protein
MAETPVEPVPVQVIRWLPAPNRLQRVVLVQAPASHWP